ncbi:MAG: hypothetical protein ACE5JI_13215 [Acidobacteriota bacterium]
MDREILERIEKLKERLSLLRSGKLDSAGLIAVEAIEQELSRTAARLPREWDAWTSETAAAFSEGVQAG